MMKALQFITNLLLTSVMLSSYASAATEQVRTRNWFLNPSYVNQVKTTIEPKKDQGRDKVIFVPISARGGIDLVLDHNLLKPHSAGRSESFSEPQIDVVFSCDGQKPISFQLWDTQSRESKYKTHVGAQTQQCIFAWRELATNRVGRIKFIDEHSRFPFMKAIDLGYVCESGEKENYEKIFSCKVEADDLSLLVKKEDGFKQRWHALTGQDFPDSVIASQDANYNPKFENLPELDLVWVSSLVIKADFYGYMLAKALKAQAERGALIKVLVAEGRFLYTDKDQDFHAWLESIHPNIQFQKYSLGEGYSGLGSGIKRIHRVMHVKAFVTYSKAKPQLNKVIVGGRNAYDGFLFLQAPDLAAAPQLNNYAGGEAQFTYFEDIELQSQSEKLILQTLSQLEGLWNRDTFDRRPETHMHFAVNAKENVSGDQTSVKSMLSIPYADNRQLEDYFVNLISTAKKSIKIVSPYFNLTPNIEAAIKQAIANGIQIDIITNLQLEGDDYPEVAEVNKKTTNKYFNEIKIWGWTEKKQIIHSKFFIIDDETVFLGSVNFNKRSFAHDLENGLELRGGRITRELNDLFESYKAKSALVDNKVKRSFFLRIIVTLGAGLF